MYPSNNGNGQPFQATSGNTAQFSYNYNGGQAGGGAAGTWNNYPGYSQQYNQHWQQQQSGQPAGPTVIPPLPQQSWNNSGAWPNPGGAGQPQQQTQQQQPQQQNQQKGCDNYQRTFDYVQQCQNWTNAQ